MTIRSRLISILENLDEKFYIDELTLPDLIRNLRKDGSKLKFFIDNSSNSRRFLSSIFNDFVADESWYKAAVIYVTFADSGYKSYTKKFAQSTDEVPDWLEFIFTSQQLKEIL
jgi:hypothetical protein